MDLIGGYLLVMLVFFTGNIALLLGNYKIDNFKLILCSAITFALSFLLIYASNFLMFDLLDYIGYFFLIVFILIFCIMLFLIRKNEFKLALISLAAITIISVVVLSSQSDLNILEMFLYSLLSFVILFVSYQLSKLLHHAKRQYGVIISEYMSLFSVLIFIFALTYGSTRALKYTMFKPFLILTPTYQLIYVIIALIVMLVVGVVVNDFKGGNS